MKKFKKFCLVFVLIIILPVAFLFGGCGSAPYVTGFSFSRRVGNVDEYVVSYSDGTTSTFQVENGVNGTNGTNGENITLRSIFLDLVELGKYQDTEADYLTFISDYLSFSKTESIQQSVVSALNSAVNIYSEFPVIENQNGYYVNDTLVSCGAGVIYKMESEYSYVLTNNHVVYEQKSQTSNKLASKVTLFQYGANPNFSKEDANFGRYPTVTYSPSAVTCEIVGTSITYDLAVLKVKTALLLANNSTAKAVTIADDYSVAERVFAIGNPEGDNTSVTEGIVSVESEYIKMDAVDGSEVVYRVLRTDSAVNGGNSGGGLFNSDGELIGIVNAKLIDEEIDNMAYALPVDNIVKVADNIIFNYQNRKINSPVKATVLKFGFSSKYYPDNSKAIFTPSSVQIVDELIIESVNENSLASNMGLQAQDKITAIEINGVKHTITRAFQFSDWAITARPGDNIKIYVSRAGQEIECTDAANNGQLITANFETVK